MSTIVILTDPLPKALAARLDAIAADTRAAALAAGYDEGSAEVRGRMERDELARVLRADGRTTRGRARILAAAVKAAGGDAAVFA